MAPLNRKCKLPTSLFCYVCGYYISTKQKKHKVVRGTKLFAAYEAYFSRKITNVDKTWVPEYCCGNCRSSLEGWLRGSRKRMPFAVPRIWTEPTNHHNNCYFCMVDISKFTRTKRRLKVKYPDIPSSTAPIAHSDTLPVPQVPDKTIGDVLSNEYRDEYVPDEDDDEDDDGDSYIADVTEPHFPNQNEVNDLIRDLCLTKTNAEILMSRLSEWNLLDSSCRVSSNRKRHEDFSSYFKMTEQQLCYCDDIDGLFEKLSIEHISNEWRLFIDSSKCSLKGVLLHNGNTYPSIPIAHSTQLKESYKNVKYMLEKINYNIFQWEVVGDLKMVAFLIGLQGGYTKYSCFLCLWDSRADDEHYVKRDWPKRISMNPGEKNIKYDPLIPKEKILLPPLHIKLGLAKQFVKALNHNSDAFKYIQKMFPKTSDAKIKAGIFIGPEIKKMLLSEQLEATMTVIEKNAWQAFRSIVNGFLGNNKSENYRELADNLIQCYGRLGCRMSIKMHYIFSHIDFFPPNLGAVSDEHGERFHQDIHKMEKRYQGRWDTAMMGDYVWNLMRSSNSLHKRRCGINKVHF